MEIWLFFFGLLALGVIAASWDAHGKKVKAEEEARRVLEEDLKHRTAYGKAMDFLQKETTDERARKGIRLLSSFPEEFLSNSTRKKAIVAAVRSTRKKQGLECKDIPCRLLKVCFSGSCTCGFCCHDNPCYCRKSATN